MGFHLPLGLHVRIGNLQLVPEPPKHFFSPTAQQPAFLTSHLLLAFFFHLSLLVPIDSKPSYAQIRRLQPLHEMFV